MELMNCWEFMHCGREPGGSKVDELGLCPAATDTFYDGINNGKNGGRICWVVAGSMGCIKREGTSAKKRVSCTTCEFFLLVKCVGVDLVSPLFRPNLTPPE
jgi:hypothetical protein